MCEIKGHFDIREYKKHIRERNKKIRLALSLEEKQEKDEKIRIRVLNLPEYKACETVLCYVSIQAEVDTHKLIESAIADGKTVAAPYCVKGTRDMRFYRIKSIGELYPGTFGVLEPVPDKSKLVGNFSGSICILPGLAFDMAGFRLGYGGGYYDRFLSQKYKGVTVGVCYNECTLTSIRHGRYDISCDVLVTDLFLKRNR